MTYVRLFFIATIYLASFSSKARAQSKVTLNHTAIYVINLEKSAWFYTTIIGLDTVSEPFHDGKHVWLKTGTHTMLHIIKGATEKKEYYVNQHTCFSVPSIISFTQKLKANAINWQDVNGAQNQITTRIDGVHQLWLQDPDGYWIEVNDDK